MDSFDGVLESASLMLMLLAQEVWEGRLAVQGEG